MVLFCDLDNTLIYSYKCNIGEEKRCVEVYQGRDISFMTQKQHRLLCRLAKKIEFIPTTTRTNEQYQRIKLGIGEIKYALTCNGGVLLENGKENERWYEESLDLIKNSRPVMDEALDILQFDKRRTFELRFIKELFVFTKCGNPNQVVEELREKLDCTYVDVFCNGVKVYVVPKNLNKGKAIERLKGYLGENECIVAGDSEFDLSMLKIASIGFAPIELGRYLKDCKNIELINDDVLFGEELLYRIDRYIQKKA